MAQASVETPTSWLIAGVSVLLLSISFGAPLLVVVALAPIAADLGDARAIPSLAASLAYFGAGLGGIGMGWLAGRTSARLSAMIGGAMVGGGLLLAAGGAAWQLLLGYGLMVGLFGNGALYPPLMTYVSHWFDRRRGTALALVSSGQYVAGLWPVAFERAIEAYGWQRTMFGFGLFAAAVIVPVAALLLRPIPLVAGGGAAVSGPVAGDRVFGLRANPALLLLATASFLCCIPMAMPAAHLVAFCGDAGIAGSRGALMLSVLLTAAFIARQGWGWVSDRIGGVRTVLAGNLCQTAGMVGFLLTQDEAGLFFVAAAYGLGFSGIVPAYVLAVRELFPAAEASWRVPVLLFFSLGGMAAGAWVAGFFHDQYGSYAVAWMLGIAANVAAIAILAWCVLRLRRSLSPAAAFGRSP